MNYLLDTHTFLWAAMHSEKLSHAARMIILDVVNDVQVSVVTFWEVSLKLALPLAPQDAATFYQLPRFQHKDPFDRLLVWQSICQHLTLLSKDPDLRQYQSHGLRVLW